MSDFYRENPFGSGRFSRDNELTKFRRRNCDGVYVGRSPDQGFDMHVPGDSPAIYLGGSGAGKDRDFFLYNMYFPGGKIINDPAGETAATCSRFEQAIGKRQTRFINADGQHMEAPWHLKQNHCNPLSILEYGSPKLVTHCKYINEMLIELTGGQSVFFEERGRQWLEAFILWRVVQDKKAPTLPEVARDFAMMQTDFKGWKLMAEHSMKHCELESVRSCLGEIIQSKESAGTEYNGTVSTISKSLSFLADTGVRDTLENPDFCLSEIAGDNPSVIYVMKAPKELLRLVFGVAMLWKEKHPKSPQVLVLYGESGQLGHFEMLERAVTFMRKFGVRTVTAWQSLGQIKKLYGPGGLDTFLGAGVIDFVGVLNYETAKLASDMAGKFSLELKDQKYMAQMRKAGFDTLRVALSGRADPYTTGRELAYYREQANHREKIMRDVISPNEILTLPDDRHLLFISGMNPILGRRTPYYKRKFARDFMPNPYHMK